MTTCNGDSYWDYPTIVRWCHAYCEANSEWAKLEVLGETTGGRPILLITLGKNTENNPGFWLDGGTHCAEWTGVMACLVSLSKWAEMLTDPEESRWFESNAIYVLPCISPDGYQAMIDGAPFIRSSLRKALPGVHRSGLDPQDINGDGKVLKMRWRHPAGPWTKDENHPMGMRRRKLSDDPSEAYFLCDEGLFIDWDGQKWIQAALKHGLDLNRNFPIHWKPFQMFGMDAGAYALSEIESRKLIEAVAARPRIAAALTNHTYTGCILTQPYHPDPMLPPNDIKLMERLANEAVSGTGYCVYKVHPDFTYDPKQRIIGVWADCLSSTFGIPGYTLELWDPFAWAGVENKDPGGFFRNPDVKIIEALIQKSTEESAFEWTKFEHPQLGNVDIGGFDYMRTIRNPPTHLLPAECLKGFQVADSIRKALPIVMVRTQIDWSEKGMSKLTATFDNLGFLSTTATDHAKNIGVAKGLTISLETHDDMIIIHGKPQQVIERLAGWGSMQVGPAMNQTYPSLGFDSHRGFVQWTVKGSGPVQIKWDAGRGGCGQLTVNLP